MSAIKGKYSHTHINDKHTDILRMAWELVFDAASVPQILDNSLMLRGYLVQAEKDTWTTPSYLLPRLTMPRRLRQKTPSARAGFASTPGLQALHDEALWELTALSEDARRKHVHWVHVRTHDSTQVQPDAFSREAIYNHLVMCYRQAYPEVANESGCIVMFGLVAKEKHAASTREEMRAEHNHIPLYCSKAHYWNKVAKISLERYNVKMHATCHDGYASMYAYLKEPSSKKPLSELDGEAWLSPQHPRGDLLRRLLETGARTSAATRSRSTANTQNQAKSAKRFRATEFFGLAKSTGFRTAAEVQNKACADAEAGDARLAEACTSLGTQKVQEHLDAAWAVLDAPGRVLRSSQTLMEKLQHAAGELPCRCGGVWPGGAAFVLQNNGEDVNLFCADVLRALTMGARRGTNLALVGGPGMGKSMLFESMDLIFKVMGKPEFRSTFPLVGMIDAEILVWQDFTYHPETLAFDDLLNLLVGESVNVRKPGAGSAPHRNAAPMFYTASSPIRTLTGTMQTTISLNSAMNERFKIRQWQNPLPLQVRRPDFPRCGRCSAKFYLENGRS